MDKSSFEDPISPVVETDINIKVECSTVSQKGYLASTDENADLNEDVYSSPSGAHV